MIRCCKDCPDRHTLCHATCERYLKEKEEVERKKKEIEKQKYPILLADDYAISRSIRLMKGKRK